MQITPIDDLFTTGAQIEPEQIDALVQAGFRAIICARPDGEERGQPDAAVIAKAAEDRGLAFLHLPMLARAVPAASAQALRLVWPELPKPVFGYCRSGARAAALYDAVRD